MREVTIFVVGLFAVEGSEESGFVLPPACSETTQPLAERVFIGGVGGAGSWF
jgi:hypothetical protein